MDKLSPILTDEVFLNPENRHARLHAKDLDKIFGFRISKIEEKLIQKFSAYDKFVDVTNRKQHFQGTEAWIGLHPQILQTPYCDIYRALTQLKGEKIDRVIDIGAAYGRVGLVLSVLRPKAKFVGFEIVKQRFIEGNRVFNKLKLKNAQLLLQNVLEDHFEIPDADLFFIYDFSEREDVDVILRALGEKRARKRFFLITKGERVGYLMKHKFQNQWQLHSCVDSSDLKIYESIGLI